MNGSLDGCGVRESSKARSGGEVRSGGAAAAGMNADFDQERKPGRSGNGKVSRNVPKPRAARLLAVAAVAPGRTRHVRTCHAELAKLN